MARKIDIPIGATNTASPKLSKVGADVLKLGRKITILGKKGSQSLKMLGGSISGLGMKFTAMGIAGGAAFGVMARTFAEFDDNMASVAAVSGATGDELQALRDKAKEMGATTKFAASEAAEGMKFLGMAGFDTKEILAGIGPVLSLAAAGAVELGEAADIASDVGSGFGLAADELGRVADVIAAAATSANTNVSMMGETFAQAAPLARAAGQSLEEAAAATGILANSGIKASAAGTGIKNVLVSIAKTKTQDKIKSLGVEIEDANGKMLPMLDIMASINEKTAKMSDTDKLAKMIEIFGKIGGPSALVLANAGDEVDRLRETMQNAEGAAKRMAETMQSALGGAFVKVKSAFEGFQIEVIEALAPTLEELAFRIQDVLGRMATFAKENPGAVKALAGITIGAVALGGALFTLGGVVTTVGIGLSGLTIAASGLAAIFTPAGALVLGIGAVGAAMVTVGLQSVDFEKILARITPLFDLLRVTAEKTFSGITAAIEGNDWGLAMEIALKGLEVALLASAAVTVGLAIDAGMAIGKGFEDGLKQGLKIPLQIIDAMSDPKKLKAMIGKFGADLAGLTTPKDQIKFPAMPAALKSILDRASKSRGELDALNQQAIDQRPAKDDTAENKRQTKMLEQIVANTKPRPPSQEGDTLEVVVIA